MLNGAKMMREIERAMEKIPTRIIEHFVISSILSELGYSRINDKIAQLVRYKILTPIKRGLYLYMPLHNGFMFSTELIANTILSPSYVSLDWALSYHHIIPERVEEVTSITIKRSKEFKTPFRVFSYKQIKKELFPIGLLSKTSQNVSFIIASKEKALCDKIFFIKGIQVRSKKAMMELLEDDLRVDLDEYKDADLSVFDSYYNISKSYKIGILAQIMQGIKNGNY